MDPAKLRDRLREVVGAPPPTAFPALAASPALERVLQGEWRDACFVVERRMAPSAPYGRARVGELAASVRAACEDVSIIANGAQARPPFLFFDLETTGLSGGAGTQAFLIGCGWFDEDGGFTTRQYMLVRFPDERALLAGVARELAGAGAIVTFNGKSFDAPLIETRYLFHRLDWLGARLPHVDVLHPARRFWGRHAESGASLVALEHRVLGVRRSGDVPGFEIPSRYFHFLRTGDAGPLAAVFEHNRLDLVSLAGLMARLLDLVRSGPEAAEDACEALALGGLYARAGDDTRALPAFEQAVALCPLLGRGASAGAVTVECLRALASAYRRARRFADAAVYWRRLLDRRDCTAPIAREAYEALAIHHEHRVRDLAAAREFALRSLDCDRRPVWQEGTQYRLARIDRKLNARKPVAEGHARPILDLSD